MSPPGATRPQARAEAGTETGTAAGIEAGTEAGADVAVEVLDDPTVAAALLDPLRCRILALLRRPGSATTVADQLGETRQKVNYHLRTLEGLGLIELVEERPRRGLTERVMRTTARAYVISPAAVGPLAAEPGANDRLSAQYLIAVAARIVREVGGLARGARRAGRALPTLTIDTEIRLASAEARAAFTAELAQTVTSLAARYHDESSDDGRWHRLVVAAHPRPVDQPHQASKEHNR